MSIIAKEMDYERSYLKKVLNEISSVIDSLGKEINVKEQQLVEFKKVLWESKGSIDSVEMQTELMSSELEASFMLMKMDRYKRFFKAKPSPYFGRIDFKEDGRDDYLKVYIGITGINKDLNHLVYDWRTPIASMFYDCESKDAYYDSKEGRITGNISVRRQYKIENEKLIRVFDNDLNVVDECLQEVLSDQSSDKMKNIVNTIQKEQNEVIRNITNKNLIVQGIAGSGKTSVALHRIAFLLYKVPNLKSGNVLVFSPNNVFTEYISNVLPELGEENAMSTTFHDFAKVYANEFKSVQKFTDFIEDYYTDKYVNEKLIKFKLSDEMISVIENYAKEIESNVRFTKDIEMDIDVIDKEYLNYLISDRYNKLPLFNRIDVIAEHLCDKIGVSYGKKKRSFIKLIKESLNIKKDYIKLYQDMFNSESFIMSYKNSENVILNKKKINYEDMLCFIYLKGLLEGFPYSNIIKQIVIDEAQDYNKLQYIILKKIFKKASFTILGDVNQTINPYQKYNSLEELIPIIDCNAKYVTLSKTYRSSSEIIEFTNKILGLNYVSAIRRPNNVPVVLRNDENLLEGDINNLKNKYKSLAIITKSRQEAVLLYENLKDKIDGISLMEDSDKKFNKNLVIVPSYLAKGLEFDSVISYTSKNNCYTEKEKYLLYVVLTRCQHELVIYNSIN